MPEPGELLGEHYRIVEIYSGGMGEVFICEWERDLTAGEPADLGKAPLRVALKTFQRRFFFDNATRVSFVREATTWLRLTGLPHIMPVIGIEQIGDRPFVLMPAVVSGPRGERTLADLIGHGSLDPTEALGYAFQVALALRSAAARVPGLVHGDLKPANVLLMAGDAYLADFGLVSAVALGHPDMRLEGTWAYRAPELWADEDWPPSVATDVYAFGALLFELLTGWPPFAATASDRASWAAAHRDHRPAVPPQYSTEGLPGAALALAIACLAKAPTDRPPDFADVLSRINGAFEEFDPVGHLMQMARSAELAELLRKQSRMGRAIRIASLLEMSEPEQALEELDGMPRDEYSATLWKHRGTALSLLNRDEEALGSFEQALAGDLSPDERVGCECELALSLKRLRRFDEARAIYDRLLSSVSDDQLPQVVVNLATVYLEQQQGDEAVRLLEPFVRRIPKVAAAWANLGQGYALVGRYEDAESAFGRALGLAPQEGRVRVMLAALYMDHLGRMEQAWAALDAAFDSGFESREWLVRTLACALLLDRRDAVASLVHALEHNFPEKLAQEFREEALALTRRLAEKYSAPGGKPLGRGTGQPPAGGPDSPRWRRWGGGRSGGSHGSGRRPACTHRRR